MKNIQKSVYDLLTSFNFIRNCVVGTWAAGVGLVRCTRVSVQFDARQGRAGGKAAKGREKGRKVKV